MKPHTSYHSSRNQSAKDSSQTNTLAPLSAVGDVASSRQSKGWGGIQSTIQHLAGEQEGVQQKTFTNWMNTYLYKCDPPIKVTNLFEDIKDGVVLLSLLKVLTGEKLRMESGPKMKRVHHISNISSALKFLENRKIKLVNINPSDIADGKPAIVLGLIWTIILYLQIEKIADEAQVQNEDASPLKKTSRDGVKKVLLRWMSNAVTKPYGIEVKDFGKSWRDGVAFNAIIHNIRPDLVDLDLVHSQPAYKNLEYAFSTAQTELGIPRLIDPEDVDVDKPDEKSIMTYVTQFLQAYPEAGEDPSICRRKKLAGTPEAEMQEYHELMIWLKHAEEILEIVNEPLTDREQEFLEYLTFKIEYDTREMVYNSIGERVTSGKAMQLTVDDWKTLQIGWESVCDKYKCWLLKLDSTLPGRLGELGAWLHRAEILLEQKIEPKNDYHQIISELETLVQEHQEFFKDLNPNMKFFSEVKQQRVYDGESLLPAQMENINTRFQRLSLLAPLRHDKLKFEISKYGLLALVIKTEEKIQLWTDKHSGLQDVQYKINDYGGCVNKSCLQKTFQEMYSSANERADIFVKAKPKQEEIKGVKTFLADIEARWSKNTKDIEMAGIALEGISLCWKQFNDLENQVTAWVTSGESVMKHSSFDEQQNFFKDLPTWEENLSNLSEKGNNLMEACKESVASEIQQILHTINQRFTSLVQKYKTFQQEVTTNKAKEEYKYGIEQMNTWLYDVSALLTKDVAGTHIALQQYLSELENINTQITVVEMEFKSTTKTAQSLVRSCIPAVVNEMLQMLNEQKESFLSRRKEISEKLKYLKAVIPNVESFESGLLDINRWLNEGEILLNAHKLNGSRDWAEAALKSQKMHFSKADFQCSLLDSKKKLLQKIISTKSKLDNVDFSSLEKKLENSSQDFQVCCKLSYEWEKKFDSLLHMWQIFYEKAQVLEDWIDEAQSVLGDSDDDVESLIRKNHTFFTKDVNKHLYKDFVHSGKELLDLMGNESCEIVQMQILQLEDRLKMTEELVPVHLIKLEFQVPEIKYLHAVDSAENMLFDQNQQLTQGENLKEILQKHRQYFHERDFFEINEENLKLMQQKVQLLDALNKDDHSLDARYEEHIKTWKNLCTAIDIMHLKLKQLPERWKFYNQRFKEFSRDMVKVEQLIKRMQQESLTGEEYNDLLVEFQNISKNLNKYEDKCRWLSENLNELLQDECDTDFAEEKKRLEDLMKMFQNLKPAIHDLSAKSSVFSKCFVFCNNIEKKSFWLDETWRMLTDQPFVDGLEEAHSYLQEHEAFMMKLDEEKTEIQADLNMGRQLQKNQYVPAFVAEKVDELDHKWTKTVNEAQDKHYKLKQTAQDWDNYEQKKTEVLQHLKKSETELEKSTTVNGQELAQKDLQAKKELQHTLSRLKDGLTEMQKLNTLLCKGASKERQGPLMGEVTDIDKRLKCVTDRLTSKLANLEMTISKWTEYYKRLSNFCDWLHQKEIQLHDLKDDCKVSPEQQFASVKVISSEIHENHVTLENLEKDAHGMSQNFRSRETSALKSKLITVRRQWQGLCTMAEDCTTSFTDCISHWHTYKTLLQQFLPWIEQTENYCKSQVPTCSSLQEAKNLYETHQVFVDGYEKQATVFEKIHNESTHLLNQQEVVEQMKTLDSQWHDILSQVEEITQKVNIIHEVFVILENEVLCTEEVLGKFKAKLDVEPVMNTADVQILQHELTLSKELQEEIDNYLPKLKSLVTYFEKAQSYTNPDCMKLLETRQQTLMDTWNTLRNTVDGRWNRLSTALQHRIHFSKQVEEFEKWLKISQEKLDSSSEIYSDDIPELNEKLKAMEADFTERETQFSIISHEFKDLIRNCSKDESIILGDHFECISTCYARIEEMVKNREELCAKWTKYSASYKTTHEKLKQIQAKVSNQDIKQEEIIAITKDAQDVKSKLTTWEKEVKKLDEILQKSQLIVKDRASQRTLHLVSELKSIEVLCEAVCLAVRQKEEILGEINQLWQTFTDKGNILTEKLSSVDEHINSMKVEESTPQGIKKMMTEIEVIQKDVFDYNTTYEEFREVGRQIIQTNSAKASLVQSTVINVNETWEVVQALLTQKHNYYADLIALWLQYAEAKSNIHKIFDTTQFLVLQEIIFTSQEDVKKAFDQRKTAEFDIHANQALMDRLNNKGTLLLTELKNLTSFDVSSVKEDICDINQKWDFTNETIVQHKENLEAQLICWDQVQSGMEELNNWVNLMVKKLEENLENFDDTVSAGSILLKYKEEAPYFTEVLNGVNMNIHDLQELNKGEKIPCLIQYQLEIQKQFDNAKVLVIEVENLLADFSTKHQSLQAFVDEESAWISEIKDSLIKCDDVSSTNASDNLQTTRILLQDLASHQERIKLLEKECASLQKKYPSDEALSLSKDGTVLCRKFESLLSRAKKNEETIVNTLVQQCRDLQQQHISWVNGANQKLTWCSDVTGDCYSIEAKLAAIKQLLAIVPKEQEKLHATAEKIAKWKHLLPDARKRELEDHQETSASNWTSLVKQMENTECSLEDSLNQWHNYARSFEELSQWLKENEQYLKNESSLKPDMPHKMEQQQHFQKLENDITKHLADFENLKKTAGQISKLIGNARPSSHVSNLWTRYSALSTALQEQIQCSQQNVTDHKDYIEKQQSCMIWLQNAETELEKCLHRATNETDLKTELSAVESLSRSKEDGLLKFNNVLEAGEKLYPSTSNEGREVIRHELHLLRERWESFNDIMRDTHHKLEESKMQWSSFDENFLHLSKWLTDIEKHLTIDKDLCDTLQEKKDTLQLAKNCQQDMFSHQTMISCLIDEGRALNSPQIDMKLQQLNSHYLSLCSAAQTYASTSEEFVEQHQRYANAFYHCSEWLANIADKVTICSDVIGDKQILQSRLDKVQDLMMALNEGKKRTEAVELEGERTLCQTGQKGLLKIQNDNKALNQEWKILLSRITDTQHSLEHAIDAVMSFENCFQELNQWLSDIKAQVTEHELKSTLKEKEVQVVNFKHLGKQIEARKDSFENLLSMAEGVQDTDGRVVSISGQLHSRYYSLVRTTKDLIHRCQSYFDEHREYQTIYTGCIQWLTSLRENVKICADLTGGRIAVEGRLIKLQEFTSEKDKKTKEVQATVECGEKLYPSTAVEGRELLRQEIRCLKDDFEVLCDEINETQKKLENCLLKWSSYTENYEQFQSWLFDCETRLQDTHLYGSLPDKKAQLQNHKVLHQDITSRQHVLDNVIDRAQSLMVASCLDEVTELQKKYQFVCVNSKKKLDLLECAVLDHQLLQDAYQDFVDWVNSATDKIEACSDLTGDRLSLQNKLERLKEYSNKIEGGKKQYKSIEEMCEKTKASSSEDGRLVLDQELRNLCKKWHGFVDGIWKAQEDLQQTLSQWAELETEVNEFSQWMKNMESQVKNFELKSTLNEKKAQLEKFKQQRETIQPKLSKLDRFTDRIQSLLQTSSDFKLSNQLAQLSNRYQNLLSFTKDLIMKWENYALEHNLYEDKKKEFYKWLSEMEQKLNTCLQPVTDYQAIEQRKLAVQIIITERDQGLQKLNILLETGEKLYPDTSVSGREAVRQEIRLAKQEWEKFCNDLSDTQQKAENYLQQWTSYSDVQAQLLSWLLDVESTLNIDTEFKNTLQEKRLQLQNSKSLYQDILLHQRYIDSAVEKAQLVLQNTSNPEIGAFITDVSSRYEKIAADAKNLILQCEQHIKVHQQYQDALSACLEWLDRNKDKLAISVDSQSDRISLENKLERADEIISVLPEGAEIVDYCCKEVAETVLKTTTARGQQTIMRELNMLDVDWNDFKNTVLSHRDQLEKALIHWTRYDEQYEKLHQWIKDMEKLVKDFSPKSTLQEKKIQLKDYHSLGQEIKLTQTEIDKMSDEAHALQQLTGETRVTNHLSQLTFRYLSLQSIIKEIVKKCGQNIEDHQHYNTKYSECITWLEKIKSRFTAAVADLDSNRSDLESHLERIRDLMQERDIGLHKLSQLIEAGEQLHPNTAAEGRDKIRQELRNVRLTWESFFDALSSAERKYEAALVQWTSLDDSYAQVDLWLREMEQQLKGDLEFKSTLEEKRLQLQSYKVLCQDIVSYQRVIDSISDKACSLIQSGSDEELSKFTIQTESRYQKLCTMVKNCVQKYEVIVADHNQYSDVYNDCMDWLKIIQEKLSVCADVTGDKYAIQHRLDKIQDILAARLEGEPKVKNAMTLAEKVLPDTALQGKKCIQQETEALRVNWDEFASAVTKTKEELENCMVQWTEFDSRYDQCFTWIKNLECMLKVSELKTTLEEKQVQLGKLQTLQKDSTVHQNDIEVLSDIAHELSRFAADSRIITMVTHLSTKVKTILGNIKDLCKRWESYVVDHEAYQNNYDACLVWIAQMRENVKSCSEVGKKDVINKNLNKLQVIMAEKNEGFHKLQITTDSLQVVLPITSVPGCDILRHDLQKLQIEYDDLSVEMSEAQSKLEGCLSQWMLFQDSFEQLDQWLVESEDQLQKNSQCCATLQEKKLQLDRIKILQLNIQSQQSTIDSLISKAETLKDMVLDDSVKCQSEQIVSMYSHLMTTFKELQQIQEGYLANHQMYKEAYCEAANWLSLSVNSIDGSTELRGDRQAVETQLQRVMEIIQSIDEGEIKMKNALSKGSSIIPETSAHGQTLIKEEIDLLSKDFEEFQANAFGLQNTLRDLQAQWCDFEQSYHACNQWIKNTEMKIKTTFEIKNSTSEVINQLESQKKLHEEILGKQPSFDDLTDKAEKLIKLTADSHVTLEISQINSCYTSLITMSKDSIKRYEQLAEKQQQFEGNFRKAMFWLQSTHSELSVCADISGDKYTIEAQLEKLQKFVVMKEEGHLLIHAATIWGEKVMANASPEQRSEVRNKLQQLQTEWENLVATVTDAKVTLESCLLQWSDFSDCQNQIHKWLKDMEKRIQSYEPEIDLSEKKANLQRIKILYQDVLSYEHVVESAAEKAQELNERSPTSQTTLDASKIATHYKNIKELAQDLLTKTEHSVAQHQTFYDTCMNFISWLQTSRDASAACLDTCGDKSVVLNKTTKVTVLLNNLKEGSQLLDQVKKAWNIVWPATALSGQIKIQQELRSMQQDYEDHESELNDADLKLKQCLLQWNDLEANLQSFDVCLKEAECYLRIDIDQKNSLEEKGQQLLLHQEYHEDVLGHQTKLDSLSMQAQELLKRNGDAGTSYGITQLSSRFQTVVTKSKMMMKQLESSYHQQESYEKYLQEFSDWLTQTKETLQSASDTSGTKELIKNSFLKIMEMQGEMDIGDRKVKAFLEAAEKTLSNSSTKASQSIRHQMNSNKTEYENLLMSLSYTKQMLENTLANWEDFDQSHEQLDSWLNDMDSWLSADTDLKSDLPEKRSCLEKYKVINKELLTRKNSLKNLENKASQLKGSHLSDLVNATKTKHQMLLEKSDAIVNKLSDHVKIHEEYRKSVLTCLEWLTCSKRRLHRINTTTGDQQTVEEHLSMLKEFRTNVEQSEEMVINCAKLSDKSILTTSLRGQPVIQQEVQSIKEDWKMVNLAVTEAENNLQICVEMWTEYEKYSTNLKQYLTIVDEQIKIALEPKPNLTDKQQEVFKIQMLLNEMEEKKNILENVQEYGEKVSQKSSDPRISHRVMHLSSHYHGLVTAAKNAMQKLSDIAKEHESYLMIYDTTTQWMTATEKKLVICNDTSGDNCSIDNKLATLYAVVNGLDEALQKVNKICELAETISLETSDSGKNTIDQQVKELTDRWKKLNEAVTKCSSNLETFQQKWGEYQDLCNSLIRWLVDTEHFLSINPDVKAYVSEKKSQLDKYKVVNEDIKAHGQILCELKCKFAELQFQNEKKSAKMSVEDIEIQYYKIVQRTKDIIEKMEKAYEEHVDFQNGQQESEKWLLQTSLQLMSLSTLNVGTIELTMQQVENHEKLVEEIEMYHNVLDKVKKKGEKLIVSNPDVLQLEQCVRCQLKHLQDGYTNLCASGQQIKEHLNEILSRWNKYKNLLDEIQHILANELLQWIEQHNLYVPENLQEALNQLQDTKTMWSRLCGLKQELDTSASQCINKSDGDNSSQSESAFILYAEDVHENLLQGIQQVERKLDQLRETVQCWELVDHLKNDMRDWLHNKEREVQNLQEQPAKLHEEAAKLKLAKFKAVRDEVAEREKVVAEMCDQYKLLTQHNASLCDPIIRAIQDDWEELLSQIDNIIPDLEESIHITGEFREQLSTTNEDLENYLQELERIEQEASTEAQTAKISPTRKKKCGSTQTPRPCVHQPSRRSWLGSNSDNSELDDCQFKFKSLPRNTLSRQQRFPRSLCDKNESSFLSPSSSFKNTEAAAVESESEESGYGDTYTMHASSVDVNEYFDNDIHSATCSFLYDMISDETFSVLSCVSDGDEANLITCSRMKDASTQTSCNVRTQTPQNFRLENWNHLDTSRKLNNFQKNHVAELNHLRNFGTQTSNVSLHSAEAQSLRPSSFMGDLLRNILLEVKHLKEDRGIDRNTPVPGENDSDLSLQSSFQNEMLRHILNDIRAIKINDKCANANTQTQTEQETQTSEDRQLWQERLRDMLDQIKEVPAVDSIQLTDKDARSSTLILQTEQPIQTNERIPVFESPSNISRTGADGLESNPNFPSLQHTLPASTGQENFKFASAQSLSNKPQPFYTHSKHRKVTQEDLNNVSKRLERLQKYQLPNSRLKNFFSSCKKKCQPEKQMVPEYSWQRCIPQTLNHGTTNSFIAPSATVSALDFASPPYTTSHSVFYQQPKPNSDKSVDNFGHHERSNYRNPHSFDDLDIHHRRFHQRSSRSQIMDRYHLDDALLKAAETARQLKRLSKKMKNSLWNEILKH